jgi:hypothetical protein
VTWSWLYLYIFCVYRDLHFLDECCALASHCCTQNNLETKIHTIEKCASVWSSWWFFCSSIKIQLDTTLMVCAYDYTHTRFEVPGRCFKTKNNDSVSACVCVSYNLKFCFLPLSLWERKKRCRRFLSKNVSKPWIRGEAEIWLCRGRLELLPSQAGSLSTRPPATI